mgnify:CR=1 FL=1
MKTYLITILVTIVLISVVQLALPKGKTSETATKILSFVLIFCFLKPLGTFSLNLVERDKLNSEVDNNVAAIEKYVDENLGKYYEKCFFDTLKENDLICEKVNVEICDKKLIKTEIYLSNLVIAENNEHININVITDYVAEKLGIDRGCLTVYG